jgi:hypothetical protein
MRQETPKQKSEDQKPDAAHRGACGINACSFSSPLTAVQAFLFFLLFLIFLNQGRASTPALWC